MSEKQFIAAFFEAALWSSNDESRDDGGDPLDKNYDVEDIDASTIAGLTAQCVQFREKYGHLFEGKGEWSADEMAGHDFWLTRNRHGVGFWDRDYSKKVGELLTKASHAYGEVDLYVGDDGVIYAGGFEPKKGATS